MKIVSTAFQENGPIPSKYTCDGENYNPPLMFSEVPSNAQSLALIVDDPDAPGGTFTHWVVYNMPSSTLQILENEKPPQSIEGRNNFGKTSWGGPCPPSGTHRYFFKLYALDRKIDLPEGTSKEELLNKMEGHILKKAELVGLYSRG